MSECVREKTVEDYIRDLVRPDLRHDYEKEINEILRMIESEKAQIAEGYCMWNSKTELKAERLQTILDCVADAIKMRGTK